MEDYKQKYENALEWIKDIYPTLEGAAKEDAGHYFPELKESEDERIRKEIINYFKCQSKDEPTRKTILSKWINWLRCIKVFPINNTDKSFIDDIKNIINEAPGVLQADKNKLIEWLEKQGEQKPTDEIEPKFKVGDWITNGIDFTFQVISIEDNHYLRSDDYFIDIETADKKFRLWTIQDAKDGDVLVDSLPFIFKRTDNLQRSYAYGGISGDYTFRVESEGEFGEWTWAQDIKPATKEQRDLLFQKMKETGYEWDSEKKELKKIKQESAWSEEDEKCYNTICFILHDLKVTSEYKKLAENWLKSLKERMKEK